MNGPPNSGHPKDQTPPSGWPFTAAYLGTLLFLAYIISIWSGVIS